MNIKQNSLSSSQTSQCGRLELAQRHIESARQYTLTLLEDLRADEWFWTPQPAITHIAWQVGHLAFAQYGLVLFRQRGRQLEDGTLMSGNFRRTFGKGSSPLNDPSAYPTRGEILETFNRVFHQCMRELPAFDENGLDEPADPPHAAFATKYGALLFAGDHEMLHAGQIGLLRRLMGKPPLR